MDHDTQPVGHIADGEIRRYLREIETNETQFLGGLLREIYEQRLQDVFQVELEIEVERHDATIESICHHHYSKLTSAVSELRQICKLVDRLKNQVTKINAKIQESGTAVIAANEKYAHVQGQRRNVNLAIEKMEECLPLLANYQKMKQHYGNGQYYRALKMIQTIEYSNLPAVSSSVSFHQIIANKVPVWRANVTDSTRRLMRKWLEESKLHAGQIGKTVIERHRKKFYLDQTLADDSVDDGDSDDVDAEERLISLTDIFKCLHISTLTNDMAPFKDQFTNDRHDQLKQFVATPTYNINSCQHYVATLIGFLHIEQELQAASPHLSRSVQDIWLKFEQRVCATFRSYQSQINSEDEYKEIKFLLSALYHALAELNLETGSIVQIQRELQRQYLEVLLRTFGAYFDGIIAKDDFTPLRVTTAAEEFAIHESFPLDADQVDANLNELESPNIDNAFPKKLPFSRMVLRIFGKMRTFIDEYLMYINGLEIVPVEKEELGRRAMTTLIRRPLRDALKKKTEEGNIGLNTLMQLSINIGCLESACGELCAYIAKKTQVHSEASQLNVGADSFKDIRSEVEANIRERIVYKIQENIELGFDMFDYAMTDDPIGPSDHIRTTLDFLDNNIKMLKKLSDKVQATTLFYVCSQLNTTLLEWLLDDGYCSQISFNSLRQIMIDVNYLENYATINNPESAEAFEAIHQLLDLLIKNDWNGYIASYSQPSSLYLRVRPADARKVFVKINWESDYAGGGMRDRMKAKQNEMSRRKLNDEIVKKLINLENGR